LTKAEQALLRDFAGRLDDRLLAMEEIQAKEQVIIDSTIDEILRAYPDFEQRHKSGRQKGQRDMTLVVRYAALAMVRNDAQFLDEALLIWFGTILKGIGFAVSFLEDSYKTLERAAERELDPKVAALFMPFLRQCTAALTAHKSALGMAMSERRDLNYFTRSSFLRFDVAKGVLKSSGGTRLLAVSDDFLRGFVSALEHETATATPFILKRCGAFYGQRLARRFENELSNFAGVALHDRPMAEFETLVQDLWNGCGLGDLQVDWAQGSQGFLPVQLAHSPMQDIGPKGHIADDLLCGIIEGFVGYFAQNELRCVQTGDVRLGDKDGTTFILAQDGTLAQLEALRNQALPHRQIVRRLAGESDGRR
jgi:hypothetical protein